MKKVIFSGVIGLVIGAAIALFTVYKMAPGLMMIESESAYGFEETVSQLENSVNEHGWKIPTTHDLQATMNKFDYEVRPVKVFELCKPDHAYEILKESEERIVSSMMPCRVAVYQKADGKTYVSRMNSALMAKTMNSLIQEVMGEAYSENEAILQAVLPQDN